MYRYCLDDDNKTIRYLKGALNTDNGTFRYREDYKAGKIDGTHRVIYPQGTHFACLVLAQDNLTERKVKLVQDLEEQIAELKNSTVTVLDNELFVAGEYKDLPGFTVTVHD